MNKRSSLEWRLCVLITGLLFALLLAVGYTQMTAQRAVLIEEKTDKYQSLSQALALMLHSPGRSTDSFYQQLTAHFMELDKDISYVVVADSGGRVLFSKSREPASFEQQGNSGREANKLQDFVQRFYQGAGSDFQRVDIPAEITPGQYGRVVVGFSSQSIDSAVELARSRLLYVFAFALLLGLLMALMLAKSMTFPLKQLIVAARSVTGGDLDVRVPVSSTDELGELTQVFNRMVISLKKNRDKLIEQANTDCLTDLYNHRFFKEQLGSEISLAGRYKRPFSVIMLDIDHFKSLNDVYGHPTGDVVLQQLAKLLSSQVRDIDLIARYGGEEFTMILPETKATEAMVVADRLRKAVEQFSFLGRNGETVPVTVSLGVAQYPIHGTEREGLVMAADLAMYQSKSMGRNRATVFDGDNRTVERNAPYKLHLLLHATDMSTIEAMAAAVDAKDRRQPGFSQAVMAHSVLLAQKVGLSKDEQNDVRIASLLHDIGKLGVPDAVLSKRGELSDEEWNTIKAHTTVGHAIVQKSMHLKSMLPGILHHHEWWNGKGYPSGLKEEEIPLIARIISVVDAYHAMMADRPYRTGKTSLEARDELKHGAGVQFDPKLVDAFVRILEREEGQTKAA